MQRAYVIISDSNGNELRRQEFTRPDTVIRDDGRSVEWERNEFDTATDAARSVYKQEVERHRSHHAKGIMVQLIGHHGITVERTIFNMQ